MADAGGGRETGRTRDAGFQVGIRRTLPLDVAEAWRLVTSPQGVRAWLGDGGGVELEPGREYTLADGARGMVRVVRPGSHLRLTWLAQGWPRPSTIQLRVIAAARGTTIALHQEHLPHAAARQERRARFAAALDELARLAGATAPAATP
jgi:uncharacterized protein YndB with AHSA1/START domain